MDELITSFLDGAAPQLPTQEMLRGFRGWQTVCYGYKTDEFVRNIYF